MFVMATKKLLGVAIIQFESIVDLVLFYYRKQYFVYVKNNYKFATLLKKKVIN